MYKIVAKMGTLVQHIYYNIIIKHGQVTGACNSPTEIVYHKSKVVITFWKLCIVPSSGYKETLIVNWTMQYQLRVDKGECTTTYTET